MTMTRQRPQDAEMPLREMNDGPATTTMETHTHGTEPEVIAHRRAALSRNGTPVPALHARSAVATSSMVSGNQTSMPVRKMLD